MGLKKLFKPLLFLLLPLLVCTTFFILSEHKQAKADVETYHIQGKIYSNTTYAPVSDVKVSLDRSIETSSSDDIIRETVTSVDGFFDLTVPSNDFSHLTIGSHSTDPYYYSMEGSVDWLTNDISANILIKEGFGAENVEIIPIVEGNNLISTRLKPTDGDFQNIFTEIVDHGTGTNITIEDLPINENRLAFWDSEQQTSLTLDESPNPPSQIESMRSYWYSSDKNTALVIKGHEVAETRSLNLWGEGMQLFGSPSGAPLDIRNLTVTDYEQTLTFDEAVKLKWFDNKFLKFNNITKSYNEFYLNNDTDHIVLMPGESLLLTMNTSKIMIKFPAYIPESKINNVELPNDVSLEDIELINKANADMLTDPVDIARVETINAQISDIVNTLIEKGEAVGGSRFRPTINGRIVPLSSSSYAGEAIEEIEPSSLSSPHPIVQATEYPVVTTLIKEISYTDTNGNLASLKIKLAPKTLYGGNWTVSTWTDAVLGFRNIILPQIIKQMGVPLLTQEEKENKVIVFTLYHNLKLAKDDGSPAGIARGHDIELGKIDNLNQSTSSQFSVYTHEMIHAWYGNWSVKDESVDEVLTEGATWAVLQSLGVAEENNYYSSYYEQYNHLEVATRYFTLGKNSTAPFAYLDNNRYVFARAVFKKMYYENKDFLKQYIKKVGQHNIRRTLLFPDIPDGREELISESVLPKVERLNTKDWLNNQVMTANDKAIAGGYSFTYVVPDNQNPAIPEFLMNNTLFSNSAYNLYRSPTSYYKSTIYKNGTKVLGYQESIYNADRKTHFNATLASDRYSKFTWLNTPKDINGMGVEYYRVDSLVNMGFMGVSRPFLWGMLDTSATYNGTVDIIPIDPANGYEKKDSKGAPYAWKPVHFENGVFDSETPAYGADAGTYKIKVTIPGYPVYTKIITKGPGEYFTFLRMKDIITSTPKISSTNPLQKFSDILVQKANATETSSDELSISNINTALTDTGANISFNTSAPTIGAVVYGETEDCDLGQEDFNGADTSQTVNLTGLTSGRTYHYKIIAAAGDENIVVSDDQTFTLFNITIDPVTVTTNSATISWHTDVNTTGGIFYGTTVAYGSTINDDAAPKKDHSVVITGLTQGTTYHFQVEATSESGYIKKSSDQVFATTLPIIISNIIAGWVPTTEYRGEVSWATNQAATGKVYISTTLPTNPNDPTQYGGGASVTPDTTQKIFRHEFDVLDETIYYYLIEATPVGGDATTTKRSSGNFTTPSIIFNSYGYDSTTSSINWVTNFGSDGQVAVTPSDGGSATIYSVPFGTNHQAILNGLAEGKTYNYTITAKGKSGKEKTASGTFYLVKLIGSAGTYVILVDGATQTYKVYFTWRTNEPIIAGSTAEYIGQSTGSVSGTVTCPTPGTICTAIADGVKPGNYSYTITVSNGWRTSQYSNTFSISPVNLGIHVSGNQVINPETGTMTFSWWGNFAGVRVAGADITVVGQHQYYDPIAGAQVTITACPVRESFSGVGQGNFNVSDICASWGNSYYSGITFSGTATIDDGVGMRVVPFGDSSTSSGIDMPVSSETTRLDGTVSFTTTYANKWAFPYLYFVGEDGWGGNNCKASFEPCGRGFLWPDGTTHYPNPYGAEQYSGPIVRVTTPFGSPPTREFHYSGSGVVPGEPGDMSFPFNLINCPGTYIPRTIFSYAQCIDMVWP